MPGLCLTQSSQQAPSCLKRPQPPTLCKRGCAPSLMPTEISYFALHTKTKIFEFHSFKSAEESSKSVLPECIYSRVSLYSLPVASLGRKINKYVTYLKMLVLGTQVCNACFPRLRLSRPDVRSITQSLPNSRLPSLLCLVMTFRRLTPSSSR